MSMRWAFGLAAIAALGTLTVNQHALAQDSTATPQTQDETEATAAAIEPEKKRRRLLMDEVIVTAQRRGEDVRDVPISMSVMSGDDMRDAGVTKFNDLALLVPNISINTDWFTLFMRGVGTSEVNVMAEQAVAYLFDNVYVARVEFLRAGFLDVERLEVLKGPQGVLFGRNSPAGVINITQGNPGYEWEGRFEGTIGQHENLDVRGMISGPIIEDKLALRLAASWVENDAYTENLFDPSVPIGGRETLHMRAKVLFDVTENFNLTLAGTYFDYFTGTWAATEQTYTPPEWKLIFRSQDPNFEDNFDRRGSSRDGSTANGDGYLVSLTANVDWNEHSISSVTAYSSYGDVSGGDVEATAFPLVEITFVHDYWQATEEVKVVSPPGDFEYVFGGFGFVSHSDAEGAGNLFANIGTDLLENILVGLPVLGDLNGPIGDIFGALEGTLGGPLNEKDGDRIACACILDTMSFAGFGQLTWRISEDLTVMAGGRYTWEKKEFEAHLHPDDDSVIWPVLLTNNGYDAFRETTYRNFSPKVSVTWEPIEEITLYATYAEGFRSGSFNIASLKEEDVEFGGETSTTYEAGVKTSFFDGLARVNLGLFWTDYTDYQITTFETINFESANAEQARVRGAEFDFRASPFEFLTLVGSLGYNDASYVKFTGASCPTKFPTEFGEGDCFLLQGPANTPPDTSTDLSGRQLFRAPKWTGSLNTILALPVSSLDALIIASGSASFRGFEYIDPDLDPLDAQPAHWIFGARLGIRQIENRWGLEVSVKNITDEIVRLTSFDAPIAIGAHMAMSNAPRTVLVKASASF